MVGPNLTCGGTGEKELPGGEKTDLHGDPVTCGRWEGLSGVTTVHSPNHPSGKHPALLGGKNIEVCGEGKHLAQGPPTSELGGWDSGRFWRILASGLLCWPWPHILPGETNTPAHSWKSRFRAQKGEKAGAGEEKLWVIDCVIRLT